jgi:glycosyltransferase involved in cell wall biosynthesis
LKRSQYRVTAVKVLFVSSGKNGKPGQVVISQGESLKEAGIEVDYLLSGPGISGYLSAVPAVRRAWKSGRYDLVHAHYSLSAFVASLAGRFPLVVSLMGSDVHMSPVVRGLSRVFYRLRWNTTVVKSQKMKDKLGLQAAEVIPNGVDIRLFRPADRADARAHIGYAPARKMVLFGSSAERREKNPALAEKAMELLGDPKADLIFLSGIPHDEVPSYLNAADLLLLTSKWEGSPNVVKEAMACNCPVVSTDVGDVRWLAGGAEGCFISSHEPENVAENIRAALSLKGRSTGRERIISLGLDSGSVAKKLREVYERVIA